MVDDFPGNSVFHTQQGRCTSELTETVRACRRRAQAQSRKIPASRGESPTLAKKLFMVDSFWGSFSMKYYWTYPPDFKAGPMSRSSWSAQIKLHFFFFWFVEREKEYEVCWVERTGGSGRS